jgi:hypothetical protein
MKSIVIRYGPANQPIIDVVPSPGERVTHRTCLGCKRAEVHALPAPDAFRGWSGDRCGECAAIAKGRAA